MESDEDRQLRHLRKKELRLKEKIARLALDNNLTDKEVRKEKPAEKQAGAKLLFTTKAQIHQNEDLINGRFLNLLMNPRYKRDSKKKKKKKNKCIHAFIGIIFYIYIYK